MEILDTLKSILWFLVVSFGAAACTLVAALFEVILRKEEDRNNGT